MGGEKFLQLDRCQGDTKLSDRLTAGLLNLSMIWHELSYEFLGFQEILGALSLLLSTTLLVLTIFVKRLKQGTVRAKTGRQAVKCCCTALQEVLYYQESDMWS